MGTEKGDAKADSSNKGAVVMDSLSGGRWEKLPCGAWIYVQKGKEGYMGGPAGAMATSTYAETGFLAKVSTLNVGDRVTLKHSGRKFVIIEERKDDNNNFEELCKFDDDPFHPVWVKHSHLSGEVKDVEAKNEVVPTVI